MSIRLVLLALIAAMVITGQQTRPAGPNAPGSVPSGLAASLDIGER